MTWRTIRQGAWLDIVLGSICRCRRGPQLRGMLESSLRLAYSTHEPYVDRHYHGSRCCPSVTDRLATGPHDEDACGSPNCEAKTQNGVPDSHTIATCNDCAMHNP